MMMPGGDSLLERLPGGTPRTRRLPHRRLPNSKPLRPCHGAPSTRPVVEAPPVRRPNLRADQSTDVPLNIGIEITFSDEGVTGIDPQPTR